MDENFSLHITNRNTWKRGVFVILFAVLYSIAEIVVMAIIAIQFLATLISGKPNLRLLKFSQSLSSYLYQIFLFMMANSEEKPYPFNPWPSGPPPRRTQRATKDQNNTINPPGDDSHDA